jgi:hypothetical protein
VRRTGAEDGPEGIGPPSGGFPGEHQQQSNTITKPGKRDASPPGDDERVLRAKYLDWCSAQVADHFLELTPDEIFELAERASRDDSIVAGRTHAALLSGGDLSEYRTLVARVTEVLTQQVELPAFEEWLVLYRADPESVEARLLGLWREQI